MTVHVYRMPLPFCCVQTSPGLKESITPQGCQHCQLHNQRWNTLTSCWTPETVKQETVKQGLCAGGAAQTAETQCVHIPLLMLYCLIGFYTLNIGSKIKSRPETAQQQSALPSAGAVQLHRWCCLKGRWRARMPCCRWVHDALNWGWGESQNSKCECVSKKRGCVLLFCPLLHLPTRSHPRNHWEVSK